MKTVEKKCRDCRLSKDISLFSNSRRQKDGKFPICKECHKQYNKSRKKKLAHARNSDNKTCKVKVCRICEQDKQFEEFAIDATHVDGRKSMCKSCNNLIQNKTRRENGSVSGKIRRPKGFFENAKERGMFYRYGIKNISLLALLEKQNSKCAICGKSNDDEKKQCGRRLAVDHCHDTGKIRGLLCTTCNVKLGSYGDNLNGVEKAISEISKFKRYLINAENTEKKDS